MNNVVDGDDPFHELAADKLVVATRRESCSKSSKQRALRVHARWRGHRGSAEMMQTRCEDTVQVSVGDGHMAEDLETHSESRKLMLNHAGPGSLKAL